MKKFAKLKPGNRKYLIIPAMPTPNGRLHLGHMSGPYLKMDVLARAQRRNGNDARVISGCDGYESYVTLKAWQTNQTPAEVCQQYSDLALQDLAAMNIIYDDYVNPVEPAIRPAYEAFAKAKMQELVDKGLTVTRPESFLYAPSTDRYIVGCWLVGKCPNCQADTGSYQCEDCGTQYRPMDIIDPAARAGETDLVVIHDVAQYLKITKKAELWQHIESMNIGENFKNIIKVYFQLQGDFIRLSNPDHWGVPWRVGSSKIPQVIYTATYMNAYAVYMGEMYKKNYGTALNPFHPDSGVTTVCSFGIDCSIPYILGLSWAIESGAFKPMDYLLPNYFCNLEDAKFSTSRGHAIWGDDIVNKTPLSSDAVRYYLCKINPEHDTTSFRIDHFINTVNESLAERLQKTLSHTWRQVTTPPGEVPPGFPIDQLESLLTTQIQYLTPPGFELAKSLEPLHQWLEANAVCSTNSASSYWWLKGFSLLAYPIMPACALSIWQKLGHADSPNEAAFFVVPDNISHDPLPVYFARVNYGYLQPILPTSVTGKKLENPV